MIRALANLRHGFVAALALLAACASTSREDEARRTEFVRVWNLYRTSSPEWPAERDRWLAKGETERGVLIENLLIDMLQTKIITNPGSAPPWEKSQDELAGLGNQVTPYVTSAMSLRASDAFALDRCIELLARLEDAAAVRTAYDTSRQSDKPLDPREENDREALVRAAARMNREEATALVAAALAEDPSWKVRAGAASAMQGIAEPSQRLQDALVHALADPDWFVAAKAAETCGKLRLTRSLPQLVDLLERASVATNMRAHDAALKSLYLITGRSDLSSAPSDWRALLAKQRTP